MNARTAKKIQGNMPVDPHRKPSEQSRYHDGQIVAAGRAFVRSLRRFKRRDPSMTGPAKWQPRDARRPLSEWNFGRLHVQTDRARKRIAKLEATWRKPADWPTS